MSDYQPKHVPGAAVFPGEDEAIKLVVGLADRIGYGNLIFHLKEAWSQKLQKEQGWPRAATDRAAGHICVWCKTDSRTGQKVDD